MIEKIKENGKYNLFHQKFMIDSSSDLIPLESNYTCHMGDIAELPNGNYYCRHSDGYSGDLWELVEVGSGGGSGSGLPSVTSSDNGKVLKVSNGQWGKGDSDKGYSTEGGEVFIQEQTVTTAQPNEDAPFLAMLDNFDFSNLQDEDPCVITYNGTEYEINIQDYGNGTIVLGEANENTGELDFTNYPFAIVKQEYDDQPSVAIFTEEPITITIKGQKKEFIIEENFQEAVIKTIKDSHYNALILKIDEETGEPDMSLEEVCQAIDLGMTIFMQTSRGLSGQITAKSWASNITTSVGWYILYQDNNNFHLSEVRWDAQGISMIGDWILNVTTMEGNI